MVVMFRIFSAFAYLSVCNEATNIGNIHDSQCYGNVGDDSSRIPHN